MSNTYIAPVGCPVVDPNYVRTETAYKEAEAKKGDSLRNPVPDANTPSGASQVNSFVGNRVLRLAQKASEAQLCMTSAALLERGKITFEQEKVENRPANLELKPIPVQVNYFDNSNPNRLSITPATAAAAGDIGDESTKYNDLTKKLLDAAKEYESVANKVNEGLIGPALAKFHSIADRQLAKAVNIAYVAEKALDEMVQYGLSDYSVYESRKKVLTTYQTELSRVIEDVVNTSTASARYMGTNTGTIPQIPNYSSNWTTTVAQRIGELRELAKFLEVPK